LQEIEGKGTMAQKANGKTIAAKAKLSVIEEKGCHRREGEGVRKYIIERNDDGE